MSRGLRYWSLLLVALLLGQAFQWRESWDAAQGWEPEQIGRTLAAGHGYAFPPEHRWLYQGEPESLTYGATAWQEPLQPLLIAAAVRLFGPRAQYAVVACQTVFLFATAVLLYLIGRRLFVPSVGMLASALLLVEPYAGRLTFGSLSSAPLVALAVTATFATLLWTLDRPTTGRCAALGAVLGLAVLASGAALLFGPVALVAVASRDRTVACAPRWRRAAALLLGGVLVTAPWVIRNAMVFGRLIPARSGFGQIAHVGNPMLASTFVRDVVPCAEVRQAPWTAAGPLAAVMQTRDATARNALEEVGRQCIRSMAPANYRSLDEVERDGLYQREAFRFIRARPDVFAQLVAAKSAAYFFVGWAGQVKLVLLLAIPGFILGRRRLEVWLLAAWIGAFATPYLISMPYFDRYRYPVEPLLLLVASYPVVALARRALRAEGAAFAIGNAP
jgi:4-amino-4-deoxy-L-arabinose transferase-like glycosyltransferase